jgi:hypothetical protein
VLVNIARSIITNDQVFDLLVHPGENSTYNLQFRAPQFQCTVSQYDTNVPLEYTDSVLVGPYFSSKLESPKSNETCVYTVSKYSIHNVTAKRSPDNTTTFEAPVQVIEQSCKPYSMLYDVKISFPRGIRMIEHKISDPKALPNAVDIYDEYVPDSDTWGINLTMSAEPLRELALAEWRQRIFAAFPISNEWAILDALGAVLDVVAYNRMWFATPPDECIQQDAFGNGTTIHVCLGGEDYEEGALNDNGTASKSRVPIRWIDYNTKLCSFPKGNRF